MGLNNVKNDRVSYEFYHDSIGNVEINEPIGFNDDELEYARNSKYHGVFTLFSNNLEFYDDSRAIVKTIYDTYGINAKLKLTKKVKLQDTSQVNTMLWVTEYEGFLDFATYVLLETSATCKFNSSGLASDFKNREDVEVEIERIDDLDGGTISAINTELVTLEERSILSVNQSVVDGEQLLLSVLGLTLLRTPLSTVVSSQNDDFSASTVVAFDTTASCFFWVQNAVASTTLVVDLDLTARVVTSSLGYCSVKIIKYNWNGASYDFVEEYEVGAFDTSGNPSNINYTNTITLALDDSLALVYEVYNCATTVIKKNITTSEETTYVTTSNDYKFVFIHELLEKQAQIISGRSNAFYSEYFGRADLSAYSSDGLGALMGFTSGLWIRNFNKDADRYKSPIISWKDSLSSLNATLAVGMGVEKVNVTERVVVEDLKYFYQDSVVIVLPIQVNNVEREVYTDLFFSELEFGYSKSGGYEREMGLDEPNIKSSFSSFVKALKNKYTKLSKVRADSYGKEFARRKPQDKFPTEDTKYDEHNWFLDIKDNLTSYSEKLWADRFAIKPTGVFSVDTLTNAWFSPFNNLLRHSWWFSSGFEKDLDKYTRFSSSTGNSDLKTQISGNDEYAENGNILNFNLERPRLIPELIKFNHNIDSDMAALLKGYTTVGGRSIPNVNFMIQFTNEDGDTENGYLKSVKPNGEGQWELIKSNIGSRRSKEIGGVTNILIDIYCGSALDIDIVDANINNAPIIGVLSYVSKTSTQVALSWTAATDIDANLDGYYVYFRVSGGATWTLFSTEASGATSKTVTGLQEYTRYDFSIVAFDTAPLSSDRSNIVTKLTDDATAPIIDVLSKGVQTDTTFPLTWAAAYDLVGVTGYKVIYQVTGSGSWTTIDTLSTDLTYTVTGLTASTSYDFKTTAYDAAGNVSSDSNTVVGSTNATGVSWYSYSGTIGYSSALIACDSTSLTETYWAIESVLEVNDYLYNSNDLTDILVGAKQYYKIGTYSYRVNSLGKITEKSSCII